MIDNGKLEKLERRLRPMRAAMKRRNKRFSKLGKAAARVAIAKDVIAQVGRRKLRPAEGHYLAIQDHFLRDVVTEISGRQFQDVVLGARECRVCALGALFTTAVMVRDQWTIRQVGAYRSYIGDADIAVDRDHMVAYLKPWFSARQLALIESAFEMRLMDGGLKDRIPEEDFVAAIVFGRAHRSNRSRMMAIMRNIIENDGTFRPAPSSRSLDESERSSRVPI